MNFPASTPLKYRSRPFAMTIVWAALLLMLASSWGSSHMAHAQTAPILPTLLPSSVVAAPSGMATIHGKGFSPGGPVEITIRDHQDADTQWSVWTVAPTAVYGPNGSADPARGYVEAGVVDEVISIAPNTVFGPNGSQDPARGYIVTGSNAAAGELHGQDLIVSAYDVRTSIWSNPILVVASR